jgi:hypothetical protein
VGQHQRIVVTQYTEHIENQARITQESLMRSCGSGLPR